MNTAPPDAFNAHANGDTKADSRAESKADWVLVANAARARLLLQRTGHALQTLRHFEHPQSRLLATDLADDQQGRQASSRGYGAMAFAARQDPHRKAAVQFAQELAAFVEQAARERQFRQIRVFAAPPFLSLLRRHCGRATQRHLGGMFNVDLSGVDTAVLAQRIAREVTQRRPVQVPAAPQRPEALAKWRAGRGTGGTGRGPQPL